MHGAGPVNESMGGAGTAACLDVTGSLAWNPACTTVFQGKVLDGTIEYFVPFRVLSSTIGANAMGTGFPAQAISGSTQSATNPGLMPSFAFVKHTPDSRNAFHFGVIGLAGFGVDYAQDGTFSNPILTAQPPAGMGFGGIQSSYSLMKVPIGVSRMLTDRLSVGVSAVPALSMLRVTPAPFAAPVSTDGGQSAQYLSAVKTSKALGMGADVGLRYELAESVSLGVSYHSPIRFREFQWNTADAANSPREIRFRMDMPALVTMGISIKPAEGTVFAVDARWIDYQHTRGFKDSGFLSDGSVAGFGWQNIWTVGGGVQQNLGKKTMIRAGYNFSQNPIPSSLAFFNTPSPAIVQHHLTAGITRSLNKSVAMHLVYYHVFNNHQTGPYIGPAGSIPGCSVTSELAENSVAFGFTRRF